MHTGIASRPQQERCPGQLRLRSSPCTSVGKHTDVNICGHAHKGTTEYICRHTHKRRMRAQTHSHKVWTWIDAARVCVTSAYFWSGLFELPSQPGTHRQTHTQMPTHVRARACTPASQPAQKRRWRRFACVRVPTNTPKRTIVAAGADLPSPATTIISVSAEPICTDRRLHREAGGPPKSRNPSQNMN